MALAMDTGRVLWVRQTLPGDAWNIACVERGAGRVNCPENAGPDFDFGSSPVLVTLADGRRLVLAGQKSGVLHALGADTGMPVWRTQVGEGGVDATTVYVSLSNAFEKKPGDV